MENLCQYFSIYNKEQEDKILNEFKRIKDDHFLDHTGGTIYSEIQIEKIFKYLSGSLFCNTHSRNIPSQQTEDAIDILRSRILNHFHTNTNEYSIIFTSNATAALKIVAETFNYGKYEEKGTFTYLEDNHTSVLGMRSYSDKIKAVKIEEAFNLFNSSTSRNEIDYETKKTNSLFVYPAQSNFSGTKYPLEWIQKVQNGWLNNVLKEKSEKWFVVLDAASFTGTNDLDLSKYKPDFIPISFYKMFGYPTGIGALIIKNSSQNILTKKYYGGGTVLLTLTDENVAVFRNHIQERFEDGTVPYLSILELNHGFDTFKRLNLSMDLISKHTFHLAKYVFENFSILHHANGQPAVVLYHDTIFDDIRNQGGIVNFNLLRDNGYKVGYTEVSSILIT